MSDGSQSRCARVPAPSTGAQPTTFTCWQGVSGMRVVPPVSAMDTGLLKTISCPCFHSRRVF
jgi:hypothetical protein